MYEIETTIGDDPNDTVVEVKGFKGEGCHAITAALEQALGEVAETQNTPEFYEKGAKRRDEQKAVRGRD